MGTWVEQKRWLSGDFACGDMGTFWGQGWGLRLSKPIRIRDPEVF